MRLFSFNLCGAGLATLSLLLPLQSGQSGRKQNSLSNQHFTAFSRDLDALKISVRERRFLPAIQASPALLIAARTFSRPDLEIQVLRYSGSAALGASNYLAALKIFLPARDLARKSNDYHDLYAIDSNISWVYLEMNNLEAAGDFSDQALAAEKSAREYNVRPVISRAYIYALSQDFPRAEALFSEAISHAFNDGDIASAALAWHLLGSGYVEAARGASLEAKPRFLRRALPAATESFRLRRLHHLPDIEESYRELGSIYAGLGDVHTAEALMERAVGLMGDPHSVAPLWFFLFWRGWLRVQQGELERALPDLRSALELARRLDVVPTDDDRVTFESGLAELYSLFIDAGNRLYLQNHDPALKAEIFEAAEENRSASLRALVPQPNGWRSRLPVNYPRVLADLQSAERNLLSNSDDHSRQQIRNLRASLHNDEVQAGSEKETGGATALDAARRALDPQTAILTFHLGPQSSWLWTLTGDRFDVYQLPSKATLATAVNQLTASIRSNTGWIDRSDALSRTLFDQIPPAIHARARWIIALDQDLFDLPIAALRMNGQYLTEKHSILLAPSIRLLEPAGSGGSFGGAILGLGDPIYNRADTRWPHAHLNQWIDQFRHASPDHPFRLARLPGTGDEVRTALSIWGSGIALTGADSTRERLSQNLNSSTGILHLATHIIPAPVLLSSGRPTVNNSRAGVIVLGLDPSGQPEFLDMRNIVLQPVKLRLVVMSGCASGDASSLPASGLMGLTRAWLGAGAAEVLATRWPVLDDSGPFFTSFYRNLKANPSGGAAAALRLAQIEMIHSTSFRNRPEYWASYFLVGKV